MPAVRGYSRDLKMIEVRWEDYVDETGKFEIVVDSENNLVEVRFYNTDGNKPDYISPASEIALLLHVLKRHGIRIDLEDDEIEEVER